jgi:hypothetical protein
MAFSYEPTSARTKQTVRVNKASGGVSSAWLNNASLRAGKKTSASSSSTGTIKPPPRMEYRDDTVARPSLPLAVPMVQCMQIVAYKMWVYPLYEYVATQCGDAPTRIMLESNGWAYFKPVPIKLRGAMARVLVPIMNVGTTQVLQKVDEIDVVQVQAVLRVLKLLHVLYPRYLNTQQLPFVVATTTPSSTTGLLSRIVAVRTTVTLGQFATVQPYIVQAQKALRCLQWSKAETALTEICRRLGINSEATVLNIVELPDTATIRRYKEWIRALIRVHDRLVVMLESEPRLKMQLQCLNATLRRASGIIHFADYRVVICYRSLLYTMITSLNVMIQKYNQTHRRETTRVAMQKIEDVDVDTLIDLFRAYKV